MEGMEASLGSGKREILVEDIENTRGHVEGMGGGMF